jgi:MraZ protein
MMADDPIKNPGTVENDAQPEENAMNTPAEKGTDSEKKLPFLGFVGSYPHSIDAKGRMIIPAAFRDALGERFAVAPSPDFQAVALYPIADWIAKRDELAALVRLKPVAQPILDMFTKYSYTDCESDAQGRLLLPQRIRNWRLGDARDVEVNGTYNHIRIIPPTWARSRIAPSTKSIPIRWRFLRPCRTEIRSNLSKGGIYSCRRVIPHSM